MPRIQLNLSLTEEEMERLEMYRIEHMRKRDRAPHLLKSNTTLAKKMLLEGLGDGVKRHVK